MKVYVVCTHPVSTTDDFIKKSEKYQYFLVWKKSLSGIYDKDFYHIYSKYWDILSPNQLVIKIEIVHFTTR